MFKRFSNQHLIITLGALLGLYLISFLLGGGRQRSFEENIVLLDTAKVSKLLITPSGDQPYAIRRNAGGWEVEVAGGYAPVEQTAFRGALAAIQKLEAKGLASKKEEQWGDFEVDESGLNLKIFEGNKEVANIYAGKTFYQQSGLMSYVRKEGDKETYFAAANLQATFSKKANDWRDKKLVIGEKDSWNMLTFSYPGDSSFQLIKAGQNIWMYSDSSATNSSEVESFVRLLSFTKGIEFVESVPQGSPVMSLAVQTLSGTPFQLSAFENGAGGYWVTSTANPGAVFDGEGLIEKIFPSPQRFVFAE